jgi:hypothetical protein
MRYTVPVIKFHKCVHFHYWCLPLQCFFSPEGGVGQTQAWMRAYASILLIPEMI